MRHKITTFLFFMFFTITSHAATSFSFSDTTAYDNVFQNPVTSGSSFAVYIVASNGAQVDTAYNGNRPITFSYQRMNPATGTLDLLVSSDGNNFSTADGSNAIHLDFNAGIATVYIRYDDVGQLTMSATDPQTSVNSSSGLFVVKPASFVITSVVGAPTITNMDTSAPAFVAAGDPFTVKVEARNSQGSRTPNFGLESPAQTIHVYSYALLAPYGRNGSQNNGALLNDTAFTADNSVGAGAFVNTSVAFDEVGIIQIQVELLNHSYLNSGNVQSQTVTVGRFTPAYYTAVTDATTKAILLPNCNGANNYIGKPITLMPQIGNLQIIVTAYARAGTITQNADANFWTLPSTFTGNMTIDSSLNDLGIYLSNAQATATLKSWSGGMGVATAVSGQAKYQFTLDPNFQFTPITAAGVNVSPFDAEIGLVYSITDSDGITGQQSSYTIGGTTAENGFAFSSEPNPGQTGKQVLQTRMHFFEAHGSELFPLYVPTVIEYYNGSSFVPIVDENCSDPVTLSAVTITLSDASPTTLLNIPTEFVSLGSPNNTLPSFSVYKISQSGNGTNSYWAKLTPSGVGHVNVTLDLSTVPWLQYRWPNGSLNPSARASFGFYSADPTLIYEGQTFPAMQFF